MTDSSLRHRLLDHALERGLLPDPVLRAGSLHGAWARKRGESRGGVVARQERLRALVERMSSGPIAEVADGMRILDLGCGWGSLSLWLAERYPAATVVGVSNSAGQREWIEQRCAARGLRNLSVETADVNSWAPAGRFDRVISIEMFEHMRNWRALLGRVAGGFRRRAARRSCTSFSHRSPRG